MINTSQYNKFFIVGATGGCGVKLVNLLLAKGKKVSILVRNSTKAKTVFKENYEKLENVVEWELGKSQLRGDQEIKLNKDLMEAIEWCDVIVSALGPAIGADPQQVDYVSTVELINHCRNSKNSFNGKVFVYISATHITRPYSPPVAILNYVFPYVYGWKALAENRLRQSGLNYLIVRPSRLTNLGDDKTVEVHQGDKVKGKISRKNVAKTILLSLDDEIINKGHVTVELIEGSGSSQDKELDVKSNIKEDDEKSIIVADHFKATRNQAVILHTILLILILYLICKFK